MSFEVDVGYSSERGPRERNEDFAGAVRAAPHESARGLIAAVADGVSTGGHGLEAAQTTVMGLLADYFAAPDTWETTVVLDRLIGAQNAWLANHNRRRPGDAAALTTLTALALQGQTWTLAHVGDTRAWLLRDGALLQLSQDHAFDHPDQRSRLTRAVGLDDGVRVDYAQGDARIGDVFVLTTDGVHGALKAKVLADLVHTPDAQAAADALTQAAINAGSRDNATALVLRVTGLDARQLDDELADGRRLPVPPLLKVGDTLDGLAITALIADTGVHRLYQARLPDSRALVALKTLHPTRASDPEERAMLAHEAWLGQRVAGDEAGGFVRVHERRADASALYTVFDWHHGRTLEQRMAAGERPAVGEVIEAALACTRALARLHRHGVVHRDIKPGNLHLGDDGAWRVLDLGVALSGRESAAQRELHAGTPSYMNPEQWDGRLPDAGSDLFALGVTLYQWLTGRLPYGEIEPYQSARYRRDPVAPSRIRPDVPIWLDHVLQKLVAREAAQRFETAEELLLALERGASRPLRAPGNTPLIKRDPAAVLKLALGLSLLLNFVLVMWLLFLPR
ncbi:MAG TPA: bifunctional protein-serine/threonine kinase/phosphatase [Ideonella sp.]|uniref:bifunctional protein-serine/threonine kinase/phosphatase n=1 Tax=Ideonella sp. TaxID=1929293 RepID=UPI002E36EE0F|nr:bifunctional protein-serine/threonine kinase/phosphatase [Ideonella sp.]HEX5682753.1 bifunctional protein-serine/threonine kinase/phosphatase [Ideonella sp.]